MIETQPTDRNESSAQNTYNLYMQLWADEKKGSKHAEMIIDELVGVLTLENTSEDKTE